MHHIIATAYPQGRVGAPTKKEFSLYLGKPMVQHTFELYGQAGCSRHLTIGNFLSYCALCHPEI